MTNTFLGVVLLLWLIVTITFFYIKKVRHGWVQFKTGLVLRFLPPLDSLPVIKLRDSLEAFSEKRLPNIRKTLPVPNIKDIRIPTRHGEIGARVFEGNIDSGAYLLVLIHGGGWCIGSINTYEEVSRRLVRETGLTLISLDYSLAPESKFPLAHEECVDAVSWISHYSDQILSRSIPLVLIGDSAGGNLIVTTTYDSTEEVRKKIQKLVAIYPAVDSRSNDYDSYRDYGHGYYLTAKSMAQFTEALINSENDLQDIRLSPLHQKAVVNFPETFVITASNDPLRDQSEAFANKMSSEGHEVILKRYPGTIHAFYGLKDFGGKSIEAIRDTASFIRGQPINGSTPLNQNLL